MGEFSWFTLDNGVRCVHRRIRGAVAYVALTVNAGTRDEMEMEHGVAHLTEHLLFRGTMRRNSFQIGNRLESHGGDLNAFTTKEETVLQATCLKSDLRRAMELLGDMAFNSKFAQKDLVAEREVIIDEINSYKDSPAEQIFDDFEELLFKGSPLGRNILGDARRLKRIDREDVIRYTSRCFATEGMVMSVSADVSFERYKELCQSLFGNFERSSSQVQRAAPEKVANFTIAKNKKTYQTHCLIGGYAPHNASAERIPLALMSNILGGPFSLSLLNQALREKRALTYNVETSFTPYCDSGIFTIYYGCEAAKSEQAQGVLMRELRSIKEDLLSSGRFARFKNQFLGSLMIGNENGESMTLAGAKSLLVFGDIERNDLLYSKVERITREEVREAANLVLDDANLNTLIYS